MYACMHVCIYMHFLIIHLHPYTFYNFRIRELFNIPNVLNIHKHINKYLKKLCCFKQSSSKF